MADKQSSNAEAKTFKDPIHGEIRLHPVLVAIVDTPQFQRLRNIKQLGNKHLVYPGATHTRFEHSIGVAHLAGEYLKMIEQNTGAEEWGPGGLDVTERDELCVQIAALCHDLGHGPFSHLFESFLHRTRVRKTGQDRWKHEQASGEMLDHLLKDCAGVELDEDDKLFIKELINPKVGQNSKRWGVPEKNFLYEIVANKETGIDVDKWDYFERDATFMGLPNNFDTRRTLQLARVITVEGETHICIRDKEAFNLYQMFHTRYSLYKRGYFHGVCVAVELMLTDILVSANEHLKFRSSRKPDGVKMSEAVDGMEAKMSKAVGDMEAKKSKAVDDMEVYSLLTDELLQQIRVSSDENLKTSRELLTRLEKRDLYTLVAVAVPRLQETCGTCHHKEYKPVLEKGEEPTAKQIFKLTAADDQHDHQEELPPHPYACHFIVHLVEYDYGSKSENPLKNVWFYSKTNPSKAFKIPPDEVSPMLPQVFKEQELRLYCKLNENYPNYHAVREEGQSRFKAWCDANGMELRDRKP